MNPAQGVSFPRSGHAIVFHVARRYFGDGLRYCDADGVRHCGCGQVPCADPARTFAKNHDFGLRTGPGVPILPDERYLVQYRTPVRSIASNFMVHIGNHPESNSEAEWRKFALKDIFLWNRFVDKWVLDFPPGARPPLVVEYGSLTAEPEARLLDILGYLAAGPVDEAAALEVIDGLGVEPRDSLAAFEFRDEAFFAELEEAAADRMAALDLGSYGQSC
jgi:hypothetical protein